MTMMFDVCGECGWIGFHARGGGDGTETKNNMMWIPCPRTNRPRENVETPSTFQTSFLEGSLGEHGRLSCLEHATEPSPPRSADGSSAADTPPSGFSAAGLWKVQLDCSFYSRAEGALTTARPPLSQQQLLLLLLEPLGVLLNLSCLSLSRRPAVSARVVTHAAVVVQQWEHSAHAERSGITTHRRF